MRRVGVERQGGRPWSCALCPVRGTGRDEAENTAAFYRHYLANHVERTGE